MRWPQTKVKTKYLNLFLKKKKKALGICVNLQTNLIPLTHPSQDCLFLFFGNPLFPVNENF